MENSEWNSLIGQYINKDSSKLAITTIESVISFLDAKKTLNESQVLFLKNRLSRILDILKRE